MCIVIIARWEYWTPPTYTYTYIDIYAYMYIYIYIYVYIYIYICVCVCVCVCVCLDVWKRKSFAIAFSKNSSKVFHVQMISDKISDSLIIFLYKSLIMETPCCSLCLSSFCFWCVRQVLEYNSYSNERSHKNKMLIDMCLYIYTYIHTHTHTHTHVCIYIYTHTHVCIYIYIYMCVCVCVCILRC